MGKPTAGYDDKKWQVEDDLRTLCRAEEIKKDTKRIAACRTMAKEKMMEMGAVAGSTSEKK